MTSRLRPGLTPRRRVEISDSIAAHCSSSGVSRMWGDGDAGDMTGRSVAGWGIVDGVGLALG
jgi:hypothetical protein